MKERERERTREYEREGEREREKERDIERKTGKFYFIKRKLECNRRPRLITDIAVGLYRCRPVFL